MGADASKSNAVQVTGDDATKAATLQPIFNETVMNNLLDDTINGDWFYGQMGAIMAEVARLNPKDTWLKNNLTAMGDDNKKKQAVIDWFNRIFWVPYKIFKHRSIQWNAAQEAVLGHLLVNYYQYQGGAVRKEKLVQAFVGGSFNEKKFDEAWDQAKSNSFLGSTFNSTKRTPSKNSNNKQPDQKNPQKQDNIMTDDGVPIAEWTLPTAREHYDNCLTAGEGKTPFCIRVAARYQELQDEQFDFEFWALVLGGGLCGLLFLFAFWWWWSGRLSSRGGGRGGRRGARKYRGGYSP